MLCYYKRKTKEEGFIMKTCEKCGKEFDENLEFCPDCVVKATTYEQALKNAKITNIAGIALIAVGIICALFVNIWLGAMLCFIAEIVCLLPNSKLKKLFKQNNKEVTDKKKYKADNKALTKELKAKNKGYKFSFIIALVALILLIAFVVCDSVLSGWANALPSDLQKDSYGSGIVNQLDTIGDLHAYANSEFHNYGNNSSNSQSSSDFAQEPVVGDFYFLYETSIYVDPATNATSVVQPTLPYITGFCFMSDGTGMVVCATNDGTETYDTTWHEPNGGETETTKCYMVDYDNKTIFVFYHKEDGYCFTSESDIVTYYYQYSE